MDKKNQNYMDYKNLIPVKNFLKANWWLLWIFLAITTISNIFIGYKVDSSMSLIKKQIESSSKKIVALSTNGQMVYAEKQSIDVSSPDFKKALVNVLESHLVVDTKRITQNFTIFPKTEDQILNSYAPLSEFYKSYLADKGKKDFVFFIRAIGNLLSTHDLVESAVPTKAIITNYMGNTDGFKISVLITVAVTYYIEETDSTKNGISTISITASGDFNPAKGNVINPLGIQFSKIKVGLVKKPRGNR